MQTLRSVMNRHCKQSPAWKVIAAMLLLTGCGGPPASDPDAPPGQADFARYCAGCHGIEGQGRPPAFPPLAGSEWLELPASGVTAIVLLGLRGEIEVAGQRYVGYMPPMQHLDDAAIARIVGYVKQRWGRPADGFTSGDVATLRQRYSGLGALEGRAAVDRLIGEQP